MKYNKFSSYVYFKLDTKFLTSLSCLISLLIILGVLPSYLAIYRILLPSLSRATICPSFISIWVFKRTFCCGTITLSHSETSLYGWFLWVFYIIQGFSLYVSIIFGVLNLIFQRPINT